MKLPRGLGNKVKVQKTWTGWRYAALIGTLIGAITLTLYPIAIEPMINPEKYKKIQKITRAGDEILTFEFNKFNFIYVYLYLGVKQDEIQPGNMRVWSNPFAPLPESKKDD